MLLGLSGKSQDAQVSFEAVSSSEDGDGGVRHGELLARLAEVMFDGEPSALAVVRDEITATMGGDALVDAVAVSANFHMMTRVADGTGTGLDEASMERLEVVREHIGVDELASRRQYPSS
jgi:hypothetical protein